MHRSRLLTVLLAFALVMTSIMPAFAGVSQYLSQDADGNVYVYDYDALKQSYTNYVLGLDGTELYEHYAANSDKVVAVYDDETQRYIDFETMKAAYTNAVLNGESFDMNEYVVSQDAAEAELPGTVTAVSVGAEGNIVTEDVNIAPEVTLTVESVSAVNGTVTVTFSEAVTEVPEGLVVYKDGEAMDLAADAFAVVDGKVEVTVPVVEQTLEEQSIVYSVKLGEADAVAADPVVVEALTITSVEDIAVTKEKGEDYALPETVTATLSDGSTQDVAVTWDGTADTSAVGEFIFNGTIEGYEDGVTLTLTVQDTVAPTIKSATAINSTTVDVEFSETIAEAAAKEATNYTADNGLNIVSAELQEDGKTVRLTTSTQYSVITYTLTVVNVADEAGHVIEAPNNTVTFGGSETPSIEAYRDASTADITEAGFTSLNNSTSIEADFNVNIDADTVTTQTVKLYNVTDGNYVPGSPAVVGGDIVFTPAISLTVNKTYRLEIAETVESVNGFALGSPLEFTYIVGTAPSAGTKSPSDGSTNIAVTTNISLTFNQDMMASSFTTDSVKVEKLDSTGNVVSAVEGAVSYDSSLRKVVFDPTENLEGNTRYQVTVAKNLVKNAAGIALQADQVWTFTTADTSKPEVTKVEIYDANAGALQEVADGATNISLAGNAGSATADVQITFNKQIEADTVTTETVLLLDKTTGVYSNITFPVLADGTSITFGYGNNTAGATLEAGHQYQIVIAGIKDTTANENMIEPFNFTFTTETSAPSVVRVFGDRAGGGAGVYNDGTDELIENNETNITVGAGEDVIIEFDEAIESDTVAGAVKLYNVTDAKFETLTINDAAVGNDDKYVIIPVADFTADKKYKLIVEKTLTDTAGNPMDAAYELYFTTVGSAPAVDTGNSTVTHNDGTTQDITARRTDVDVDGNIIVDFNKDVASSAVTTDNFTLVVTATEEAVPVIVTRGGTGNHDKVTIDPVDNLADATSYTLTVSKSVTDEVGNTMAADFTYEFVTENNLVPSVIETSVENNATDVAVDANIVLTFNTNMTTGGGAGNVDTGDTNRTDDANTDNVRLLEIDANGNVAAVDYNCSSAVTYNSATKQVTLALGSVTGTAIKYNQKYAVEIDAHAKAADGTAFNNGNDYRLYFTTVADTTAPSVANLKQGTTEIADGATNVARDADLVLTFNDKDVTGNATVSFFNLDTQAFDGWFDSKAIAITDNGANADSLTIDLSGHNLSEDTHYKLTIANVKDARDNVMPTYSINITVGTGPTLTVDTDGPNDDAGTTYADAADGANTVLVSGKVRVEPNEEIDTTTVTADTAYIQDANGNKVAATITFDGANHNFTITPDADLAKGTTYHVYLTDGIKDIAGNKATAVDFTFSTELDATLINFTGMKDNAGNTIAANGLVQEANTATLKLNFDKDLDSNTVNATNVKLHDDTDSSYVTLLDGNLDVADGDAAGPLTTNQIVITPLTTLTAGHVYTVEVTGIKGTGTPAETLANDVSHTFAVQETSLTVTDDEADDLMKQGDTTQLTVLYGSADVTGSATYTSSDTNLATVNSSGVVTAQAGNGTVTITASYDGKSVQSATFTIDNTAPVVSGVSIAAGNYKVGDAIPVTITADAAGYSAGAITINGQALGGFTDKGDNTYTGTYTVVEGDTDRAAVGDIPISVVLTDAAGNSCGAYTTAPTSAGAVTIDANPPTLASVITQNNHATVIQVTVTEANDLYVGSTKVNTGVDCAGDLTITDTGGNVTSVVIPADCSGGGVVAITLADASSGDLSDVVIDLGQIADGVGNALVNDTTAANTVLTITDNGTTWSASLGAAS